METHFDYNREKWIEDLYKSKEELLKSGVNEWQIIYTARKSIPYGDTISPSTDGIWSRHLNDILLVCGGEPEGTYICTSIDGEDLQTMKDILYEGIKRNTLKWKAHKRAVQKGESKKRLKSFEIINRVNEIMTILKDSQLDNVTLLEWESLQEDDSRIFSNCIIEYLVATDLMNDDIFNRLIFITMLYPKQSLWKTLSILLQEVCRTCVGN